MKTERSEHPNANGFAWKVNGKHGKSKREKKKKKFYTVAINL